MDDDDDFDDEPKDFLVKVAIRNNNLISRRRKLGLNQAEFARQAGINPAHYCAYETMRITPLQSKSGDWKVSAMKVADFLMEDPVVLWPAAVLNIKKSNAEMEASDVELLQIKEMVSGQLVSEASHIYSLPPDTHSIRREFNEKLEDAMKRAVAKLAPERRELLEMRFGLNGQDEHTLQEIGDMHGLSREMIRVNLEDCFRFIRHEIIPPDPDKHRAKFKEALAKAVNMGDDVFTSALQRALAVHEIQDRKAHESNLEEITETAVNYDSTEEST